MTELRIDPEFRDKIPPLTEDEFKRLEENIVTDGVVREPLVVWNETIVDGHHRWAIIQKHPEVPYTIKEMDFADRWAAISWMCANQLGRRNISDEQKTYLLGKLYEARKNTQGGDRRSDGVSKDRKGPMKNYHGTRSIVAEEQGVSQKVVLHASEFAKGLDAAEEVSAGFREKVLSGEVKAPKSTIAEIRKMPEEERAEAVKAIESGSFKSKPKAKANYADGDVRATYKHIRELSADMADINKPKTFTIDNVVSDLESAEDNFINQIHFILDTRSKIVNEEEENREKIIAFLEGAIHDLTNLKGEICK